MRKNYRMYLLADFSLLIVAVIWGLTFVTVKNGINILPTFNFNFYRFTLAAVILCLIAVIGRQPLRWSTVKAGLLVGVFLFAGYSLQTLGLSYTTAANAGFFTGLQVIFVPLLSTLTTRKFPGIGIILGTACAALGLFFFSGGDLASFNTGDILIICCAFCFALHVILVGRFSPFNPTDWLVAVQVAVVGILSGISSFVWEGGIMQPVAAVWPALIITSLFATCFAFFVQNYMQRFTSPGHTAIIFTSEPVFAALFAVLLLQEELTASVWRGGAVILAGMLLAEIRALPCSKKQKTEKSQPG